MENMHADVKVQSVNWAKSLFQILFWDKAVWFLYVLTRFCLVTELLCVHEQLWFQALLEYAKFIINVFQTLEWTTTILKSKGQFLSEYWKQCRLILHQLVLPSCILYLLFNFFSLGLLFCFRLTNHTFWV